jgi:hypothetical protein
VRAKPMSPPAVVRVAQDVRAREDWPVNARRFGNDRDRAASGARSGLRARCTKRARRKPSASASTVVAVKVAERRESAGLGARVRPSRRAAPFLIEVVLESRSRRAGAGRGHLACRSARPPAPKLPPKLSERKPRRGRPRRLASVDSRARRAGRTGP